MWFVLASGGVGGRPWGGCRAQPPFRSLSHLPVPRMPAGRLSELPTGQSGPGELVCGDHVTGADAQLSGSEGPPWVGWLLDIVLARLGCACIFCLSITWQTTEDIST